jgi:hypothetical protein
MPTHLYCKQELIHVSVCKIPLIQIELIMIILIYDNSHSYFNQTAVFLKWKKKRSINYIKKATMFVLFAIFIHDCSVAFKRLNAMFICSK